MIRPGIKKLFRLAFHRREDAERDVRDEIRLHVELRTEQLIGGGMVPDEARSEAERKFGSIDDMRPRLEDTAAHREAVMRKREWWESFTQDLRYVVRSLKRSPTFVISATLTLALGLGANAALFSVLDRLYLQTPTGIPGAANLHRVYYSFIRPPNEKRLRSVVSPPEFLAMAAVVPAGVSVVGYRSDKRPLGKDDSAPVGGVTRVLGDYFTTVGIHQAVGRNFSADEVRPEGVAAVAIVSSSYARAQFGSDRDAVDKPLDIGSLHLTIVGVAPAGFRGTDLDATDVWIPMNTNGARPQGAVPWYEESHSGFIRTIARAANDASLQAFSVISTEALRRNTMFRGDTATMHVVAGSIREMLSPDFNDSQAAIATRLGVVAFAILLIACANVANLLLARALQRRREIGVRLALGVSRGRLISQLLTESVVLAAIGGIAAIVVAIWTATALRHALLPNVEWGASAMGVRAVGFAIVTTLVAGLAAGLVPALHASRPNLTSVLRGGTRDGTTHRSVVRASLLISQIALSCVLLAGAGLFVRSLRQVEAIDIGYDTDRVVLAGVDFARGAAHTPQSQAVLFTEAVSRIEKLPGVERVALASSRPLFGFSFADLFTQSGDSLKSPRGMNNIVSFVSPGYFPTMGMHMLQGRDFSAQDREGAEYVVVVNATFAKIAWPGEPAIGKCFRYDTPDAVCRRVVGVVSDSHFSSVIEQPTMQYYLPMAQAGGGTQQHDIPGAMEIYTAPGRAAAIAAQAKQLLIQLSSGGMKPWAQTLSEQIDGDFRTWRLGAALFSAAGLLALLVAGVGIYGTIAYTFSQRTQEIGVRIALGAQGSSIIALVLKSSVAIAAIGVVIGTGAALWAGRFAKPLLYDTAPNNPFVLGGVALVLLAVAVIASLVPAMRAKNVDPLEALRAE
jgi:putative ABC transport system permease protein